MRVYILVFLFLGVCSFQDIKRREISWKVLTMAGAAAILMQVCTGNMEYWEFIGGIVTGLVMLGVSFATKEALGYGDGFSVMVAGMLLGFTQMIGILLLAFIMAAFVSGALLIFKKVGRKYELPFLPFLLAAAMVYGIAGGSG